MLNIEDRTQLIHYLTDTGRIGKGEEIQCRTLAGGVSCSTVLVTRAGKKDFVIKQALPRLRVASNWTSSPERSHREAQGIRTLRRLLPAGSVPELLFEDSPRHILAMEAVPQPHNNWKQLLLSGTLVADHARQFGKLLGTLHSSAYEQRAKIEPAFRDYSNFETLRLEPYYEYTLHQVPEAADFLGTLIKETRSKRCTLTHGDYSPKNVLIIRDRLVLLDHETIHWGDPAFDLGFSLTHFLSKANRFPERRSDFIHLSHTYWQAYGQHAESKFWDNSLETRVVQHTLACLLARISGRSPLEYLRKKEQDRQCRVVLKLMHEPDSSVPEFIDSFHASL